MKSKRARPPGRVLVVVDASLRGKEALEAAADFAAQVKAHLLALFVEDVDLLRLAELPFARELDRASGALRPMDMGALVRALQADAERLRRRLDEESRKRRISVSMQVVRGQYLESALRIAGKTDIVILNDVTGMSYGPTDAPTVPGSRRARRPVWVLFDGSRRSRRALALAAALSERQGSELVVMTTEDPEVDKLEVDLEKLSARNPDLHCERVALADPDAVAATAKERGCALLVVPRKLGQTVQQPGPVFRSIRCPRVLV